MRFFIIVLITTFVGKVVFAGVCDAPDAPESVRIYFANGMNNTYKKALESRRALTGLLGTTGKDYGTAYNDMEQWMLQNYEVYKQRKNSSEEYWYWLRNLHTAPQWFLDEYVEIAGRFDEQMVNNDSDLTNHIQQYLADLNSGKKVLIVAHSQGNFYANNAYRYIRDHYPHYQDSIGIISVGTPATWVEGRGVVDINDVYTTNPADTVISLVEDFYPDTLDPNVPAYDHPYSLKNHAFIKIYLAGYSDRIRGQILDRINSLQTPDKDFECKEPDEVPVSVLTMPAGAISITSARLHGYVQSGKQISSMCVYKLSANGDPATCSYFFNYMASSGIFDTGDNFYCTVDGLSQNTEYKFRVCGREGDRISDGGVRSFKTSISCGTPLVADGGSEGLVVNFGMGPIPGYAQVQFEAFTIPDWLEIRHGGITIYTTGGYVSGFNSSSVYHNPSLGQEWEVRVYGNSDTNTAWELNITCPNS